MKIVKGMFLKQLFIFLWSLLFIIPGIIKAYEYYCVPFILAENPDVGSKRAIEISKQMTSGYKADIFITELSFLGWQLLGMLACCVGQVFVVPYIYATYAEMYAFLKYKALENGICSAQEIGA